ncbi:TPA: hypothetical protein BOS_22301 [Bos taurus]|nr:TPA: hypothetical protein BOS_22301 [Bos taurus]
MVHTEGKVAKQRSDRRGRGHPSTPTCKRAWDSGWDASHLAASLLRADSESTQTTKEKKLYFRRKSRDISPTLRESHLLSATHRLKPEEWSWKLGTVLYS